MKNIKKIKEEESSVSDETSSVGVESKEDSTGEHSQGSSGTESDVSSEIDNSKAETDDSSSESMVDEGGAEKNKSEAVDPKESGSSSSTDSSSVEEKSGKTAGSEKSEEDSSSGIDHDVPREKRTVFIKGLSYDVTESDLRGELEKLGKIIELTYPVDSATNKSKGFAFVEYKREEDAKKMFKFNKKHFLGRDVIVDEPRTRRVKGGSTATLFVKNIPYECSEDDLREYFSKHGEVDSVRIPKERDFDNRNKGFAFVEFQSRRDLEAILKKKLVFDDRVLYVDEGGKQRENGKGDGLRRGDNRKDRSGNGSRHKNDRFGGENKYNDKGDRKGFGKRGSGSEGKFNSKKIKFDDDSSG
jgi:nucleolin